MGRVENTLDYKPDHLMVNTHDIPNGESTSSLTLFEPPSEETKEIPLERFKKIKKQIGQTAVGLYLLESEQKNGELLIVFPGWGGNIEVPIARLEATYLAKERPDTDILFVNNPGSGLSSALDSKMSREIAQTGSFNVQGKLYAKALKDEIADYDSIDIYGNSYGGRTSISTTAHLDKSVENLIVSDPPGSRKLGFLGLVKRFVIDESTQVGKYLDSSPDDYAVNLQRDNDKKILLNLRNAGPKASWQQLIDQVVAMEKDTLEADLEFALDKIKPNGNMVFYSPEFSQLNRPQDVLNMLNALSDTAAKYNVNLIHKTIMDHSHALLISNPRIHGKLVCSDFV